MVWMEAGQRVFIDGSRAYLERAREIYPTITVLGIEADPACLIQRLRQRGREDEQAILERLRRNETFASSLDRVDCRIQNNRRVEEAAMTLLSVIRKYS